MTDLVESAQDNNETGDAERKPAADQERAIITATLPQAQSDEPSRNQKQDDRTEQWKIIREWLTILGLLAAAGAAIYQGVILSRQASTLNGQLVEMKTAARQTDKLIQSNADLAAAAKAQAVAEANSAATAHDSFIMTERARIASVGAALQGIQVGQGIKATVSYVNFGREAVLVDVSAKAIKWSKSDWKNGAAAPLLVNAETKCMETTTVAGTVIANPTYGLGGGYTNTVDPNDDYLNASEKFVADDGINKGDTVVSISACFVYKTISEVHHSSSCYFYLAGTTPNFAQLNICSVGNGVD